MDPKKPLLPEDTIFAEELNAELPADLPSIPDETEEVAPEILTQTGENYPL
jgi:hypothetical protein